VEVESGETILASAQTAGVAIDSACGGQGVCGKCKVMVTLGRPGGRPGDLVTKEELEQGMVLACQATVEDDLVVEVPLESQRGELRILTEHALLEEAVAGVVLAERVSLQLQAPEEHGKGSQAPLLSDGERLVKGLATSLGDSYSGFDVDVAALRALPRLAREEGWKLDALVGDFDAPRRGSQAKLDSRRGVVFGVEPGGARGSYGVAVDVGTTTVVVHLIDLRTAGFLDACASLNDQVAHGEDVITRIIYTQEHQPGPGSEGGLVELREAVRSTINRCVRELAENHGIGTEEIIGAACVGNTVMTHLLLGIDPAAIRREPYVPAVRWVPTLRAGEVGLEIHPSAPTYLAPCVSSYVGGDVTAGALATAVGDSPRLTLFIDMGTNGEIVVGGREWLMCCSASAGPAFEGSGVEYGMYATVGGIERLSYEPETDRVEYTTIGDAKPRGICGSGLVDALATLLRTEARLPAGVIDRAGKINLGFPSPRVRVRNERPEFVFVWGEEVGRADDISLGEDDIQNLIRAKSAVYAGATTLLDSLGLEASSVEEILVAGAFGNYLDAESAVMIGLLPDVPLDRIRFVGNTAVAGARLALLSRQARSRLEELAGRMTSFELSLVPGYMDRYVGGLFLPHTDLRLFPSVAQKLAGLRPPSGPEGPGDGS
jgi:uncharacterized 2Fe-2S/4Fe-4S cluster protein (DUF4445 family)